MLLINDGLPEVIYNWLCVDFYDHEGAQDSISATTLLKPTQEIVLTQRHAENIEIKASGRVWSVFGSGVHAVLDKMMVGKGIEKEERLKANIVGRTISGKFDLIKDGTLYDYKVTSAFTIMYGSRVKEWVMQLSIYRWLYHKVKALTLNDKAYIITILKDWRQSDVGKLNYPISPIIEIPIDLMGIEETEHFIILELNKLIKAEKLSDSELPACTDEERWYNAKKKLYMKCDKYCTCKDFCRQFKEGL
jgi:hypothetical protein